MVTQQCNTLHALFFPLIAHGHLIPLFDAARLFASREGVTATIVTTPANALVFTEAIANSHRDKQDASFSNEPSSNINVEIIPFPSEAVGLPPGVENFENVTDDEMFKKLFKAMYMLREPLGGAIGRLKPSCLVSDEFYPWTLDVAARFGIPRLVFHGSCFFSSSAMEVMRKERPHKGVSSDYGEFVVPGLPDKIMLAKSQLSPEFLSDDWENPVMKMFADASDADRKSFGVIMNSFYELETRYADYYREVLGKRAWNIGPVSLCNRNAADKATRGKKAAIDEQECLKWLDSKPPNSVIYVSFGSMVDISSAQLREIATALEASDQNFIWVVKKTSKTNTEKGEEEAEEDWLPDHEFEKRNKGKGLIIRGWAPQVLILDHEATGGFLTHCGWNSTLEAIAGGVPMVTWPIFAEQFLNEKLITQMMNIGLPVGSKKYCDRVVSEVTVGSEAIEKAIRRVMVGEEAAKVRRKAKEVKEMAWRAVERGGSSYEGLSDLLKELRSYHIARQEQGSF